MRVTMQGFQTVTVQLITILAGEIAGIVLGGPVLGIAGTHLL